MPRKSLEDTLKKKEVVETFPPREGDSEEKSQKEKSKKDVKESKKIVLEILKAGIENSNRTVYSISGTKYWLKNFHPSKRVPLVVENNKMNRKDLYYISKADISFENDILSISVPDTVRSLAPNKTAVPKIQVVRSHEVRGQKDNLYCIIDDFEIVEILLVDSDSAFSGLKSKLV